jgi:carbon storage regulator
VLVLSRKKQQTIRIGDEVIIKIIEIKGGTVRIGIEAPDDIGILRGELIPGAEARVVEQKRVEEVPCLRLKLV